MKLKEGVAYEARTVGGDRVIALHRFSAGCHGSFLTGYLVGDGDLTWSMTGRYEGDEGPRDLDMTTVVEVGPVVEQAGGDQFSALQARLSAVEDAVAAMSQARRNEADEAREMQERSEP